MQQQQAAQAATNPRIPRREEKLIAFESDIVHSNAPQRSEVVDVVGGSDERGDDGQGKWG